MRKVIRGSKPGIDATLPLCVMPGGGHEDVWLQLIRVGRAARMKRDRSFRGMK
jgi:hypothetical protein